MRVGYVKKNGIDNSAEVRKSIKEQGVDQVVEDDRDESLIPKLIAKLNKGDTLVVYGLHHIDVSIRRVAGILAQAAEAKIYVYSVLEDIDTRGINIQSTFGMYARFERLSTAVQDTQLKIRMRKIAKKRRSRKIKDLNRFRVLRNDCDYTHEKLAKEIYNCSIRTVERAEQDCKVMFGLPDTTAVTVG